MRDLSDLLTENVVDRPAWHQHAACRGVGPDVFFPTVAHRNYYERLHATYCAACPVLTDCTAQGATEPFGLWGSLTHIRRRTSTNHSKRARS